MPGFGLRHPLARFVVVGCANFVVSFAAFYWSYHYLPLGESSGRGAVANVLAYAAGMINSFVLNRLWTFRAEGQVAVHAFKFVALNAATLVASTGDRAGARRLGRVSGARRVAAADASRFSRRTISA